MFGPGRVTYHHIMGAILLYLTIAIIFVALFTFVGSAIPKAFSGLAVQDSPALASNLIYFSFATLTTTGYGDIFPVHPIARSLCNLEFDLRPALSRDAVGAAGDAGDRGAGVRRVNRGTWPLIALARALRVTGLR